MDLFNLPLLLCAAASTLAFVTITQTTGCESSTTNTSSSQSQSRKRSGKWKGEGGALEHGILTDANLTENLNSGKALFIDLHAEDWCGHCQDLAPIWNKFINDCCNLQTIKVLKCDAEKNTDCSTKFKVQSYPTIVLYKNGEIIEYKGDRKAAAFCEFLKKHCQ